MKPSACMLHLQRTTHRWLSRFLSFPLSHSLAVLLPLVGLAGCQVHPVQLQSTGRTVTIDEIRRTQRSARERLARVPARIDVEEWWYAESQVSDGAQAAPASAMPGQTSTESAADGLPLRGERRQYVWDAGHRRMAIRSRPVGAADAAPEDRDNQHESLGGLPQIQIVQRLDGDREMAATLVGNMVVLGRYGKDHHLGARAYNNWLLQHGLENDFFFQVADGWGGRMDAVQEDGRDLVRVTWSALGMDHIEWFRPDQGFRLHRRETRDMQRRLRSLTIADDYRDVNGFPYPFFYEVTLWDEWDPRRIASIRRFKVHRAELGAAVSDEEFLVDIPAGAVLTLMESAPSLLPGPNQGRMLTHRVDAPLRADVQTLFRMVDAAQTQPAGEVTLEE